MEHQIWQNMYLDFNSYLSGLFEGDGHIWISQKKINPRFCITTHEKNEPWLLKLKENLNNYGFIRRKSRERALVLTISNINGLILIVNKLNGNLKTPKIEKFYELIDWLNLNCNSKLEKLPINLEIENNAWLCGFIEANGSFYIRCSSRNKLPRINVRFSLYQRMISKSGMSYEPIMDCIAKFLNTKLRRITKKNNKTYFYIDIIGIHNNNLLKNYLDKYPLFSSKYLDYLNWKEALIIIENKFHLNEYGVKNIKFLKSNMNNSRWRFNWNHLKR